MAVATLGGYLSGLVAGYRMPDVSKLWSRGETVVDGKPGRIDAPAVVKLEAFLVRIQELSLWTDPKSSAKAVAALNLIFVYLSYTSNTTLHLTCWAIVLGLLYTTWVNTIWPEIRVAGPDPDADEATWTPVRLGVYSGPELVELTQNAQSKLFLALKSLKELRSKQPGMFCLCSSFAFAMIALIGTQVTTLGLIYFTLMGYLTVPGILRHYYYNTTNTPMVPSKVVKTSPDVPDFSEKSRNLVDNVTSIYAHVQSCLTPIVSNMGLGGPVADQDDLQEYLPEVEDEHNKKILEGAQANISTAPEEYSLEYTSLITGLGSTMPDVEIDEPDSGRLFPDLLPSSEDYFLPADQSKNIFISSDNYEDDDDDRDSTMCFSDVVPSNSAEIMPSFDSDEFEKDDFEIISEAELAEAMRK